MRAEGNKDHSSYWKARIKKNTYRAANGITKEQQGYLVQIAENKVRKWFNLRTANAEHAARKARDIYRDIQLRGLKEVHSDWTHPMPEGDTSVTKFIEHFWEALKEVENPPLPSTAKRYVEDFKAIVRTVNAKHLGDLTANSVDRFKRAYRKTARESGRKEDAIRNTMNRIIRQAKRLYSRELVGIYKSRFRIEVASPFEGVASPAAKLPPYQPLKPQVLDTLWNELPKLRDGDPDAAPPDKTERYVHLTNANPAAYLLFLLEVTMGLRRNEADKAEWSWITETPNGAIFTVTQTDYFKPKSGDARPIPMEQEVLAELKKLRQSPRFIVPGNDNPPKLGDPRLDKGIIYRCERAHRALVVWLRRLGVTGDKPCHRLRKEFGSYLATKHGLFAAQRLLGHSSPEVTAKYYAGLTDLPEISIARING